MVWLKKFWDRHGDRLVFATLAILVAVAMWMLGMAAEAKTIIIGVGMLFFNKARTGTEIEK